MKLRKLWKYVITYMCSNCLHGILQITHACTINLYMFIGVCACIYVHAHTQNYSKMLIMNMHTCMNVLVETLKCNIYIKEEIEEIVEVYK